MYAKVCSVIAHAWSLPRPTSFRRIRINSAMDTALGSRYVGSQRDIQLTHRHARGSWSADSKGNLSGLGLACLPAMTGKAESEEWVRFVIVCGLVAKDRFTLKSPNGIAYSEFSGI